MTLAIKEAELWDVDYGIKLPDNFTIKAVPYKKKCKYYFYTPEKVEVDQFEADFPTSITERSVVGSKIKEHLNFNNTLNNRGVSKKFSDLKIALTNFVEEYVETEKRLQTLEETEKLQLDKEGLDAALHLFETTSDCILRIANYIDWYTAGERLNILLALFCFCSQIILKTPISVVGLGDGSSGKALSLDTKIPTPTGYTTMADLEIGDEIFGADGEICKVSYKSPIFINHDCYEITFDKGIKVIADAEHLWSVKSQYRRDKLLSNEIKTTEELFKDFKLKHSDRIVNNYSVDVCEPIQLPEKCLPIDPYLLGLWLGDGHSQDAHFSTIDLNNKHIPYDYLRGSYNQRLSLIQGLMDTDGTIDKNGNCTFTQKNEGIIDGFLELLHSMGIKAVKTQIWKRATNGVDKSKHPYWNVNFTTILPVFQLGRKLVRLPKKVSKTQYRRYIHDIKLVESVPTQCIQVDNDSHLYLFGEHYIPTHNTHIMEEALSLIPESYILREKKPTIAAMFRRSEEDPYYYDGKIVVYGDMGGENDQDDVIETKNILKELQSDGYVNRPITVKTSDGFVVVDLELKGNPCLGYTTVPNYTFDDQELSRSLIFTPRTNNRKIFNARKNYLELKGGKTEVEYQEMLKYKENIRNIVEGLRYKFSDIDIINPYSETIFKFIGDTEYYKRDYDKFNSILKVITAFNSNGREVKMLNGRKVIFTNPEDIQYFLTLLDAYSESISSNLSLKASEILKDLKLHIEDYEDVDEESREYGNTLDYGITVVDYLEQGEVKLEKRSLQRYFSELNNQGFIKVTGKRNRANMYDLVRKISDEDSRELLNLSKGAKKRLGEEYTVDICKYLSMCDDMYVGNLSINDQLEDVIHPKWLSADKRGVKSKSDT